MFKSQQYRAKATECGELGSVGKLLETAALRGQIARFLHKQAGRGKLPLTEDTPSDARSGAAALSRWDNEGGAVREELPI